ncbi:hypothetical protein HYV85_04030 [Candidatus Woesearchaeota archaeon]|nr:hypothetical protein [Candidatus Woesearchaeota archaeon]
MKGTPTLETTVASCYGIMLRASQFLEDAAAKDGISRIRDYLPLVSEALFHLRDFHNATISRPCYCPTNSPNKSMIDFSRSLIKIGNQLRLNPEGARLAYLTSEQLAGAGNEFIRIGRALESWAHYASFGAYLVKPAFSNDLSLRSSEAIVSMLVEKSTHLEGLVGEAELVALMSGSVPLYVSPAGQR